MHSKGILIFSLAAIVSATPILPTLIENAKVVERATSVQTFFTTHHNSNHTLSIIPPTILQIDPVIERQVVNATFSNTIRYLNITSHRAHEKELEIYLHQNPKLSWRGEWKIEEKDHIIVGVGADHGKCLVRHGEGNEVVMYIAGKGEDVVKIQVDWSVEESSSVISGMENLAKVFIG